MLLAIDTSAGTSVALIDGSTRVVVEHAVSDTMRHAEVIGPLIEECLRDGGVRGRDVDAVAVGMGPGPFTGLRVGIAAGRVFAFGCGVPVLPVVSHDAIAFDLYETGGPRPVLVVTDARRKELYWSLYSGCEAGPQYLGLDYLARHDLGRDYRGCMGDAPLPVRLNGPGLSKPDALPAGNFERCDARTVSAAALGRVAAIRQVRGLSVAPDEPLYLRSPDVTPSFVPKLVS